MPKEVFVRADQHTLFTRTGTELQPAIQRVSGTDNMSVRRIACGSKESDPLSRFPRGKPGRGRFPPTPRTMPASQPRWQASMQRLPPQEGFQSAPLKPPLRHPPDWCHPLFCLPMVGLDVRDPERQKELKMAATSALTFTTFS